MKILIEENDLIEMQEMLTGCTGYKFHILWIHNFVSDREEILSSWYEWGTYDTCFREYLIDCISKFLIGKKWPTGRDIREGLDMNKFLAEFNEAAEKTYKG
ncbi:MAG: hypothetical protein ACW97P_10135 [Candidatus Hodarchaeales archaeon]|jgi:hypothetical protein